MPAVSSRRPGGRQAGSALLISALLLAGCAGGQRPEPAAHRSPGSDRAGDVRPGGPAGEPEPLPPEAGAVAEGRLAPDETALHPIPLCEGEYVELHLDRSTREAEMRLLAPPGADGSRPEVGWGETAVGAFGQTLWSLAPGAGTYHVAVEPRSGAETGGYRLRVLALHLAGPDEQARQAGQEAWDEAMAAQRGGRHEEALEHLRAAHRYWSEAGYLRGVAAALGRTGRSQHALHRLEEAAESFRRAAEAWEEVEDSAGVAASLNLLAGVEIDRHRWAEARQSLDRGLELTEDPGREVVRGHLLETVCKLHVRKGQTDAAIGACQRSVDYWRDLGRSGETVDPLVNLGLLHRVLGDLGTAESHYRQGLEHLERHPDPGREATIYNNLAIIHDYRGELQKALLDYQRALELHELVGNRSDAALALHNMASIKEQIGDLDQTLAYYREARRIQEEIGDVGGLASTLFGIGGVHLRREHLDRARMAMEEALALGRASGAAPLVADALHGMAELRLAEDRPRAALEALDEALALVETIGNRWKQADLLGLAARAALALGRDEEALSALRRAAAINEDVGHRRGLASNYYEIARVLRQRGRIEEARLAIEAALAVVDLLWERTGDRELRSRVAASHQQLFELFIDLLMEEHARDPGGHHAAEALREAERARAKGLLEVLAGAELDLARRVPAHLLAERRELRRRLEELERRRARLLRGTEDVEESAELFRVKLDLDQVLLGLAEVERRMRAANPGYGLLTRPQPVSVGEIRQWVVDQETVLLEYRLGEERSFLFVVEPDGELQAFELPPRKVLEEEARCAHWLITAFADPAATRAEDRRRCLGTRVERFEEISGATRIEIRQRRRREIEEAYRERARRLADLLLGRARDAGALDGRRIAVVPDGALVYIPFGALPLPGDTAAPLLAGHEVVHLPSASVLAFQRQRPDRRPDPSGLLAVVADPVYNRADSRLAKGANPATEEVRPDGARSGGDPAPPEHSFPRLAFSADEARAIAGLVDPEEAFVALGLDASREIATGPALADYRYVHFAAHGVVDTEYPRLSGLVLSLFDRAGRSRDDGFLRLEDVYDMRLNADMVVLSACDTALGREVRGEGLIGLSRGFMHAGAERVVASLWRAHDLTTAVLMEGFYHNLLVEGRPPGDALRRAQLDLMNDSGGDFEFPYYWAGFTLQGDWR